MVIVLSGPLYLWALRAVAFCYLLTLVFHVAVPELVTGLCWLAFFVFSFVKLTGE